MCGRYRLSQRKQIIEEHFGVISGEEDWNPRHNIAPTQTVPIIRQHPKEPRRELSLVRWGLIPQATDLAETRNGAFTLSQTESSNGPCWKSALHAPGVKLKYSSVICDRQNARQAAFVSRGFIQRCQTLTAAGLSASPFKNSCL